MPQRGAGHGEAETIGYGTSHGTSVTEGESETFVTDYALLPIAMYSLQEQLHHLAGEIQNLNHDGKGLNIQIASGVAVSGRLVLREYTEKDAEDEKKGSKFTKKK